ncbi:MAG: hypothetical protein COY66_01985 [Candidatus Kerfeldbacteria bacterium CG_4_10_14_0_8_um_filter_42_10]|uniref:Phosphoribosyl-ATP pyrophosphohydrolase n=1 Tax=Candidatus Kerfeldbacteria bacterium CG_4_10_14_0_8_um_filter_42_10 TaxID=2014248 RepID=A0A2M7RJI0_9BACT|nr:MAG: hypothetical protein COY66_01985 [Candidatus Kerfeldbacteria bacterium CG_4_10_14_0_8_um_filter_42_10]
MKETAYNKLVRDRIPEIIRENGDECDCQIMEDDEFRKMLKEKLAEEAAELIAANGKAEMIDELADISEIIESILETEQIAAREVAEKRNKKKEARGGFTKKIKLISTKEK